MVFERLIQRAQCVSHSLCGRSVFDAAILIAWAGALPACTSSEEAKQPSWREEVIYAQVGEVVYELAPGDKTYSLADLSDEDVAGAVAAGKGTKASPLALRDLRVGVVGAKRSDLKYDVTIVRTESEGFLAGAVPLDRRPGDVRSVAFEPDIGQLDGTLLPASASLRLSDGDTIELPVECAAQSVGGELRIISCATEHLVYRGNLVGLRSLSRDATGVAQDFRNSLKMISEIEGN